MLVAILSGAAQVGSFAKQFPALKSAAGQAISSSVREAIEQIRVR
jgi:hypothetical protein